MTDGKENKECEQLDEAKIKPEARQVNLMQKAVCAKWLWKEHLYNMLQSDLKNKSKPPKNIK